MKSILSTIVKPYYIPAKYVELNYDHLVSNPSPKLTKFLVNNMHKIDILKCRDINQGLIVHFIEHFKVILPGLLLNITDPKAAPAIIEIVSRKGGKYTVCDIRNNPNPGLTQFLIDSKIDIGGNTNPALALTIVSNMHSNDISTNTNPDLADYILSCEIKANIFSNPNPGLTKYIIKNYRPEYYKYLACNTNPELADLIIRSYNDEYLSTVCSNPNPGLVDFIINLKYRTIAFNTNPKVFEFAKKRGYVYSINGNPLIAKLKRLW